LTSNDIEGAVTLLRKAVELEPDAYNQSALSQAFLKRLTYPGSWEAFNLASEAARLLPDDESTIVIWMYAADTINDIEYSSTGR
jgi:hypothetical protein